MLRVPGSAYAKMAMPFHCQPRHAGIAMRLQTAQTLAAEDDEWFAFEASKDKLA
jgi:hypothetical protein